MPSLSSRWINWSKFYLFVLLIASLNACSDAASEAENTILTPTDTEATLVSVELSLNNKNESLALNTQIQLFAVGIYSDNSKRDITKEVLWNSTQSNFADFGVSPSSTGVIFAKKTGVTQVTASLDQVTSQPVDIEITDATLVSIVIEPPMPTAVAGTTKALTAVGYFSNNTQQIISDYVTWVSSNTDIAIVNDSSIPGLVTAINNGTTNITAQIGSMISSPLLFTVGNPVLSSIVLEPIATTIGLGTHIQFIATGVYADSTTQDLTTDVVWASSNNQVAFISNNHKNKGLATALSAGVSSVSAQFDGISSDTAELTITAEDLIGIKISAEPGTQTEPITMALGTQLRFRATGIYNDLTEQDLTDDVVWVSQDSSIAVIDNAPGSSGLVIPLYKGLTEISALFHGILSTSVELNVTDAQLVSIDVTPTDSTLPNGTTKQYTAIGHFTDGSSQDISNSVTWVSGNTTIATVSNTQPTAGLATANTVGTTDISAQLSGVTSNLAGLTSTDAVLTTIDINPMEPSIAVGLSQQFSATGTYSDLTTADITDVVTWQSTLSSVATVSNATGNAGLAISFSEGSTTVSANYQSLSAATLLTVTAATLNSLNLSPPSATLQPNQTQQFTATAVYTNGSVDITNLATWTSTNPGIASVVNGLATANLTGATDISVAYNGLSISSRLTVDPSPTITVSSAGGTTSVAIADVLPLSATGGTAPYLWSVDNTNASINTNTGLVTGQAVGSVTVTATDANGNSGNTIITVTLPPVVLDSIDINPKNANVMSGQTLQFAANGTYSDLTTADITNTVTWTSSNPAILSFSSATNGLATATAGSSGAVIITSALNGISSLTQLTIVAPVISVSTTATLIQAQGATAPFSASGGTAPYSWSVDNTMRATIDPNGILTPLSIGIITVTATDSNGFSGSGQFNVAGPLLAGLFPDAALQACIDNYAAANGFTTTDQITTLGTYCQSTSPTKIVSLDGMEKLTNLVSLDLAGNAISNILPLAGLTQLTTLHLQYNKLSVFSDLASLTNLTELSIGFNIFTETTDLSALSYLTKLQFLYLSNINNIIGVNSPGLTSDATNNTLAPISALSGLQYLDLRGNQITSLGFLSNLTGLTYLILEANPLSSLTELGGLVNLNTLDLRSAQVIDISPLSSLSMLYNLDLAFNSLIDPTIFTSTFSPPNSFNQLTNLDISSTGLTDLSALSNLTSLYHLRATANGISDVSPLVALTGKLSQLILTDNTISNIAPLESLTNLTYLILNNNKITDLTALGTLTKLTVLDVGSNIIANKASFSALSNMPLLTNLTLAYTGITDVSVLSGLTNMRYLFLNDNNIGGQGVGNVDQLTSMSLAIRIWLDGASNIGMSCQELDTLITALNVNGTTVVTPAIANPTTTTTNPQTCTAP